MTAIDISKLARAEDVRIVEYKGERFNITVDGTSALRKRIAEDHEMRIARVACSYMLDTGLYDVDACIEYVIRREQKMENQYAIFKKQDGTFFFNPNCYPDPANVKKVGDVVDGIECVKVCGLKEAEDFIAAHNPPAGDLFADLMQ